MLFGQETWNGQRILLHLLTWTSDSLTPQCVAVNVVAVTDDQGDGASCAAAASDAHATEACRLRLRASIGARVKGFRRGA